MLITVMIAKLSNNFLNTFSVFFIVLFYVYLNVSDNQTNFKY